MNNAEKQIGAHMREVIWGGAVTFMARGGGTFLGFLFNLLLARLLGAAGSGLFFLALSFVLFCEALGRLGLEWSLVRYTASAVAQQNWGILKGIYLQSIKLCTLATVTLTLILLWSSDWIGRLFVKPEIVQPLLILSLAMMPIALARLMAASLRGLKLTFKSQMIESILPVGSALLLTYPLFLWSGVIGVAIGYLAGWATALFVGWRLYQQATSGFASTQPDFPARTLLSSSVSLVWITISGLLMNQFAIFALGAIGVPADVGIFNVAMRTSLVLTFVLFAANNILLPKFSELISVGNQIDLEKMARNSVTIMSLMVIPIWFVIVLFSEQIMGWFGTDFRSGAMALEIMAHAQLVNVLSGPAGDLLIMGGHERLTRFITLLALLANMLLCIVLIPSFGLDGAAVAVASSSVFQSLACLFMVRKHFGFWMVPFSSRKSLFLILRGKFV
jgi:O-antigen/teichoic acid export membrane protein